MRKPGAPWDEEDLLPLSALQHLLFCERQCALIHVEGQWRDNPLTLEGEALHERVDQDDQETRGDLRIARGLRLRSLRLGLVGRADAVEFQRLAVGESGGVSLEGAEGSWRPRPVEFKRGKPKEDFSDRVQLCAQALCLEEMLDVAIPQGALYYGRTRRRLDVPLDEDLRRRTEEACQRLRDMLTAGETPIVRKQPKCRRCSLLEVCQPDASVRSARTYLDRRVDGP